MESILDSIPDLDESVEMPHFVYLGLSVVASLVDSTLGKVVSVG